MRQPLNIMEEEGFISCQQCGGNGKLKECAECMATFCPKCFASHILDTHVRMHIYRSIYINYI